MKDKNAFGRPDTLVQNRSTETMLSGSMVVATTAALSVLEARLTCRKTGLCSRSHSKLFTPNTTQHFQRKAFLANAGSTNAAP